MINRGVAILLVSLGAVLVAPAVADPLQCPDASFAVQSSNPELGEQLCQMAPVIRDGITACRLSQDHPLTIEVVAGLSHPAGECLAYFDCDKDLIRVTDPAYYPSILDQDNPYTQLPPDVTLRALLTHEMTHALVFQSAGDRKINIVDQEYIAAVLELDLMEPKWRDVLVAAAPVSLPPKAGLIDIWIYGLEPRKFATNAWQHFSLPENGCDLVSQIVQGKASFSSGKR